MKNRKGSIRAIKLLKEIGFDEIIDLPMDIFVSGLGATLIEEPLKNSDGRIIRGNKKTLIKVNSEIPYLGRRRFTIAHEIGHYLLHDKLDLEVHDENTTTLNWFKSTEFQGKKGVQEWEANDFASELLMPSKLFIKEQKGKKFSPSLLRELAKYFKVSITSVAFKYFESGDHPICLFHSHNKQVSYWKRPDNYPHFIIDRTKLKPPPDSVVMEFFEKNKIYPIKHSKQPIWKSTWFDLKDWEKDEDYDFYEYCIVTPSYNSVLSVVWEE